MRSKDSVDVTDNTQSLVRQLTDNTKLVLTTIQNATFQICRRTLDIRRLFLFFDECHRSQFGETHERITKFFEKSQLIGFQEHPYLPKNFFRMI
jgi:type I restriction enzyme R subunit